MLRFFLLFLVIQSGLFAAELTPPGQALVIPWTATLARLSVILVTLFGAQSQNNTKTELEVLIALRVTNNVGRANMVSDEFRKKIGRRSLGLRHQHCAGL